MNASAILTADDRTRVPLSKVGAAPRSTYRAEARDDGTIVLTPVAIIPAREMVVWEDETLRQALVAGLAQASVGLARANPGLDAALERAGTE